MLLARKMRFDVPYPPTAVNSRHCFHAPYPISAAYRSIWRKKWTAFSIYHSCNLDRNYIEKYQYSQGEPNTIEIWDISRDPYSDLFPIDHLHAQAFSCTRGLMPPSAQKGNIDGDETSATNKRGFLNYANMAGCVLSRTLACRVVTKCRFLYESFNLHFPREMSVSLAEQASGTA